MLSCLRACVLSLLVLAAGAARATAPDATLEEQLSYAEFKACGLEKLSPEELQKLNAVFARYRARAAETGVAPAAANAGSAAAASATAPASNASRHITAHVKGAFSGWSNGTVIALDNGQRWRVVDDEPLTVRTAASPAVEIEPGMLGGWTLKVEGYPDSVHVVAEN
jgi:hypothetical protein